MKYRCIPCDYEFEVKDGEKPRCPQCMKIHDLEKMASKEEQEEEKRKFPIIPIVLLVFVVGAGGYCWMQNMSSDEDQTGTPVAADLGEALNSAGMDSRAKDSPFFAGAKVKELAEGLCGDDDDGLEGLRALWSGIVEKKDAGAFGISAQRYASVHVPLRAEEFAAKLAEEGGESFDVTSYELAALLLATARALSIDAHMAEIRSFSGEKKPADSPGKLGRYGVVWGNERDGILPPLFDPYGGRSGASAKGDIRVLSDGQAAAPFYAIKAMASLVTQNTEQAMEFNDLAIKLDPDSPRLRCVRGWIFLPIGAFEEAMSQFEKAVQMAPQDPAIRLNLAEILLSVDPTAQRAKGEIQAALSKAPDYARAHAMLAIVHLIHRDMELSETELGLAQSLEPDSPFVASGWAKFYAAQSMASEAIEYGQKAVRLAGRSMESLVELAGIYKMTARFGQMRTILDEILAMTDSPVVRESIKKMFGYEVEEKSGMLNSDAGLAESADQDDDEDDMQGGKFQLKLNTDSKRPYSFGRSGNHNGSRQGENMRLNLDLNNAE